MGKRTNQTPARGKRSGSVGEKHAEGTERESFVVPAHPPAQNRPLLVVSLVLFGLWILFLLYNALLRPL
jgi:hypothetical protein